jgi:hypothetical protein
MKIDKPTIGLPVAFAAVAVLIVFSASFPALGDTAEQNAAVTANTTAIKICSQNGSADYAVNYWNFSGQAGTTVDNPTNSLGEAQDTTQNHKPVACLNNTNAQTMTVTLNAGTFSGSTVYAEYYNNSVTVPPSWSGDIQGAGDITYGSLAQNANGTLWLRVILKSAGSGTSTFTVTCEA